MSNSIERQSDMYGIYEYGGVPDESYLVITPKSLDKLIQELLDAKEVYLKTGENDIFLSENLVMEDSITKIRYITFKDQMIDVLIDDKSKLFSDKIVSYLIVFCFVLFLVMSLIGLYTTLLWIF